MERPIAFKVLPFEDGKLFRMKAEPIDAASIKGTTVAPAVVVARKAAILGEMETGIFDAEDILAITDGDWTNAILIVVNQDQSDELVAPLSQEMQNNDADFLDSVRKLEPSLAKLAEATVAEVRSQGVEGKLVEKSKGRWVNSPINSFTLKAQPRKKNLQFTLYGNPSSYEHGGFLRPDQNSYSRGWVETEDDVKTFAGLVFQAHSRKKR
ncbi:hypothetical protein [Frigidibacter sp. ROC022]|uniref:hypothetical protein n=1 Tax=Frigidibacter sp. ROC022 TaxID=2971796 RepID=UPI00215B3EDB|nr:hypothetical protein [Frigidibacter sp. ROC022]MCR8724136.1 hypothetical protein [Frigidibacter sp. ROC022]